MRLRGILERCARLGLAAMLLAGLAVVNPSLAQPSEGAGETSGEKRTKGTERSREKEKKRSKGGMRLVVDNTMKRTWTEEDLKPLATAKWLNKAGKPHHAIPLETLLKEGGVQRETIKELQFVEAKKGKVVLTLSGEQLSKIDQLMLRTGQSFKGKWKLATMDSGLQKELRGRLGDLIAQIEVVTTKTSE